MKQGGVAAMTATQQQEERVKALTLLEEIAVLLELARADERYYSDPTLLYDLCAMLRALLEVSIQFIPALGTRSESTRERMRVLWTSTARPQRGGEK